MANVLLCSSYIEIVSICVRTSFLFNLLIILNLQVYKKLESATLCCYITIFKMVNYNFKKL